MSQYANGKKDGFRVHSAVGLSSAAYILDSGKQSHPKGDAMTVVSPSVRANGIAHCSPGRIPL